MDDLPPGFEPPRTRRRGRQYRDYRDVPLLRQSGVNSWMMVLALITCIPLVFVTCLAILTGDIYYNRKDRNGSLEVWPPTNKLAAFVIILINVGFICWMISLKR